MDTMYICRTFRMGIHFRRKDVKCRLIYIYIYIYIYILVGVRLWEILQDWWRTKLGYAAPFIVPHKVTSYGMTHARHCTGNCPRWKSPDEYSPKRWCVGLLPRLHVVITKVATATLPVHYRVHKLLLLVPILSQAIPVHALSCYLFKIHFNIIPV